MSYIISDIVHNSVGKIIDCVLTFLGCYPFKLVALITLTVDMTLKTHCLLMNMNQVLEGTYGYHGPPLSIKTPFSFETNTNKMVSVGDK